MVKNIVGENIRKKRKELGLTQKELAKMIATTQQNIVQYEKGLRNPKIGTLKKIAYALNTDVSNLLGKPDSDHSIDESYFDHIPDSASSVTFSSYKSNYEYEVTPNNYLIIKESPPSLPSNNFYQLNETGRAKALEFIDMLVRLPEFNDNLE